MPVRIRLSRQGRKKIPFYHIVVADSRAPRDGKYIERIGRYYPKTNPATIELDFDRALYWLQTGAQPSDTCRSLLSAKGVLYKNHLLNGVKKNALTLEQAEAKFAAWLAEKEAKLQKQKEAQQLKKEQKRKEQLEREQKAREAKAAQIAQKAAEAATATQEEEAQPEANS
ncbi:MAG: 30S ribosomal protein S16 [Bacteroidales bacterium]|nr:30S ribosomal protein S16 [Bacteroidales bacterium]HOK99191.1 30S ribosomal protein S16 [Bacteroidales bacterium]HPO65090.1 30S ribosomal protein S16 [Bacteroidales bacterium]